MNQSLHVLFIHDLKSLYDAENQLAEALPKMSEEASNEDLKRGFAEHAEETNEQIEHLKRVFMSLKIKPERIPCKSIRGLIEEGREAVQEVEGDEQAKDAALLAAAQKVEHLETGAYDSASMLARVMDHDEAASMLEDIRDEEVKTSKKLESVGKKVLGMTLRQKMKGMVS